METTLNVKVTPKSAKTAVVGWENGALKVRLNAAPEKGAANAELIAFLAKMLGLSKSCITLIAGAHSRHKRLRIQGYSEQQLLEKINGSLLPKRS